MRKLAMLIVLAQMLFAATTGVATADQSARSVTTHGLTVHFGIVPADKASRVPDDAGVPGDTKAGQGQASYHLVVALFDARTGSRIDDAVILARMTSPAPKARPKVQIKRLPAFTVNGMVTYGNYFDMPWRGGITSIVRSDDATVPIRFKFD